MKYKRTKLLKTKKPNP